MPRTLSNRMVELRNNVIHRGKLPERRDALKFGGEAYDVIQTGIRELRDKCFGHVQAQVMEHGINAVLKKGWPLPQTTQIGHTVLDVTTDISAGYQPFSQVLARRSIQP